MSDALTILARKILDLEAAEVEVMRLRAQIDGVAEVAGLTIEQVQTALRTPGTELRKAIDAEAQRKAP